MGNRVAYEPDPKQTTEPLLDYNTGTRNLDADHVIGLLLLS